MSHTVAPPKTEIEHPPGARLDSATLTGSSRPQSLRSKGTWVVTEHIGTGEAAIWWRNPPANPDTGVRGQGGPRAESEADRRARREVRRYCVRNGLDRLGTATYAPEHLPGSRSEVWADVERFRKRLNAALGEHVPMLVVIEHGGKSGRLHIQFAFGRYIDKAVVQAAWGRGFIDLRKLKVAGTGKRERCRRAAAYCAKYISKGDGPQDDRAFNARRYSSTKGFGAVRRSIAVDSSMHGYQVASAWCGGEVVWTWSSATDPDWLGPPVICVHFGDEPPNPARPH